MTRVFVGVGSNIDKHLHINQVLFELSERFDNLQASPVYETEAVGFVGDSFYNLVVAFDTDLQPDEVFAYLRALEAAHGRRRTSANQFVPRTLDLDQLLYGDQQIDTDTVKVPNDDILKYPFVLKPLVDISGDMICPGRDCSFRTLWQQQSDKYEPLRQVFLN